MSEHPVDAIKDALFQLEKCFEAQDFMDVLSIEFDRKAKMPVRLKIANKGEIPRIVPEMLELVVQTDGTDVQDALGNIAFRLGATGSLYTKLTGFVGPR